MNTMTKDQVQDQLNAIGYLTEFTVIFMKKDGTQRKIKGFMDKPKAGVVKNPDVVPICVTDQDGAFGQWRSFRTDSVLSITPV